MDNKVGHYVGCRIVSEGSLFGAKVSSQYYSILVLDIKHKDPEDGFVAVLSHDVIIRSEEMFQGRMMSDAKFGITR